MDISNQVFKISGEKARSLVVAENALQIMSRAYNDINSFNEAWNKKITLVAKAEIKYDTIKSITLEDGQGDIVVTYKETDNSDSERKFRFDNHPCGLEDFYAFFQQEKGYIRTEENVPPMKAIAPSLLGLILTIVITGYGYSKAASMEAGTYAANEGKSRGSKRGRFFDSIFGMLGTKGVLFLGTAIATYFGFTMWNKYKNPPVQIKLSNPN